MQLFWELDQAKPAARDPAVRAYLGDRREPVDPAAREYQALKDKLNNYRHLHVHVAYEVSRSVCKSIYLFSLLFLLHFDIQVLCTAVVCFMPL